jgi:hypothetical protein
MGNNITLLTPKGEFNNNLFYAKGHVVYSGYSIYVSLVDDNNAELTDTNSWAMLLDGSKIGTAIAEVNDLNDNAGYRALVNKVNTLLAEYAKNEQSFTDTFNKNETKRQEDWYNQLKTDEEQRFIDSHRAELAPYLNSSIGAQVVSDFYDNRRFVDTFGKKAFLSLDDGSENALNYRNKLLNQEVTNRRNNLIINTFKSSFENNVGKFGKYGYNDLISGLDTQGMYDLLKNTNYLSNSEGLQKIKKEEDYLKETTAGGSHAFIPSAAQWQIDNQRTPVQVMKNITDTNNSIIDKLFAETQKRRENSVSGISNALYENMLKANDAGSKTLAQSYKDFDKLMDKSSNFYAQFKNSEWLKDYSNDDRLKDYAKYLALANTYGKGLALDYFNRSIQNRVAKAQDDKWTGNTLNKAVNTMISDLGSQVAMINGYAGKAKFDIDKIGLLNQGLDPDDPIYAKDKNDKILRDKYGKPIIVGYHENKNIWSNPGYWNDVYMYNTRDQNEIALIKQRGGISPYVNVHEYGYNPNEHILSWDTAREGFAQSGHLAASLLETAVLGGIGKGIGYVAGNGLRALGVGAETLGKISKVGSNAHNLLLEGIASMNGPQGEAMGTFNEQLENNKEAIDNQIKNELHNYYKTIDYNSKEAQNAIRNYYKKLKANDQRRVSQGTLDTGIRQLPLSDKTLMEQAKQAYTDSLLNAKEKELTISHQKALAQANRNAAETYITNWIMDYAKETALTHAIQKFKVSKGATAGSLDNSIAKDLIADAETHGVKRAAANAAKNFSWKKMAKATGKQVWGGFQDEYLDGLNADFSEAMGSHMFKNYLDKNYNPKDYNATMDTMLGNMLAGMDGFMNGMTDRENIYEGAIGAISPFVSGSIGAGAVFHPEDTYNALVKGVDEKGKPINIAERISNVFTNPLLDEYARMKAKDRDVQAHEDAINKVVKQYVDNGGITDISRLVSAMNNYSSPMKNRLYQSKNGEHISPLLDSEDNKLHNVFTLADVLDHLNKTEGGAQSQLYQDIMGNMKGLAEGNLSDEEMNAEIDKFLADEDNKSIMNQPNNREIAADRLQKNAKYFMNLLDKKHKIEETFDKSPSFKNMDEGVKTMMKYNLLAEDDYKERLKSIEDNLGTSHTDTDNEYTPNLGMRYPNQNARNNALKARDRRISDLNESKQEAEQSIQDSVDKIHSLENRLGEDHSGISIKIEQEQNILKAKNMVLDNINENIEKAKAEKKVLEENLKNNPASQEFTEDIINNLDARDRAFLFDENNQGNFTKEQQKVIQRAKEDLERKDPDAMTKIHDAGTLADRISDLKEMYSKIKSNDKLAADFIASQDLKRKREAIMESQQQALDHNYAILENLYDTNKDEFDNAWLSSPNINSTFAELYMQDHPEQADRVKPYYEILKFNDDAKAIIDSDENEDDAVKQNKKENLFTLQQGVKSKDEVIKRIEQLIDDERTPKDQKEYYNDLLTKMEKLGYQRDQTVLESRKERLQREAEDKAKRETEEARKQAEAKAAAEKAIKANEEAEAKAKADATAKKAAEEAASDNQEGLSEEDQKKTAEETSAIPQQEVPDNTVAPEDAIPAGIKVNEKEERSNIDNAKQNGNTMPISWVNGLMDNSAEEGSASAGEMWHSTNIGPRKEAVNANLKVGENGKRTITFINGNQNEELVVSPKDYEVEASAQQKPTEQNNKEQEKKQSKEQGKEGIVIKENRPFHAKSLEKDGEDWYFVGNFEGYNKETRIKASKDFNLDMAINEQRAQREKLYAKQGNTMEVQLEEDSDDNISASNPTLEDQENNMPDNMKGTIIEESSMDSDIQANVRGEEQQDNSATQLSGYPMAIWSRESLQGNERALVRDKDTKSPYSRDKLNIWLDSRGIHLRDIIDHELADILNANPHTKVKFMATNSKDFPATREHKDYTVSNNLFMVLDYDNNINKGITQIHNDSNGGVIETADGKKYLIIGVFAYKNGNTAQQALYNNLWGAATNGDAGVETKKRKQKAFGVDDPRAKDGFGMIRNERDAYFPHHTKEVFYVSPNFSTEIVPYSLIPGWNVHKMEGDTEAQHRPVIELMNNEKRNPYHITLDNASWAIQEQNKFLIVSPKGTEQERMSVMAPSNTEKNLGATFILFPAANGKMFCGHINACMYKDMKEGSLKEKADKYLNDLMSSDYETRVNGIKGLYHIFYFNNEKNKGKKILTNRRGQITFKRADETVFDTFTLGESFDREHFIQRFIDFQPRVNITAWVLGNKNAIKEYSEAGALNTDLAQLALAGSSYSVYSVNVDGTINKPIEVVTPVTKSQENKFRESSYDHITYYTDGKVTWYDYNKTDGKFYLNGDEVTDENLIKQLEYNRQVTYGDITYETEENGYKYYIIRDTDNPLVIKINNNYQVTELSPEDSRAYIDKVNKDKEAKARDKAAQQVLSNMEGSEDVNLGIDTELLPSISSHQGEYKGEYIDSIDNDGTHHLEYNGMRGGQRKLTSKILDDSGYLIEEVLDTDIDEIKKLNSDKDSSSKITKEDVLDSFTYENSWDIDSVIIHSNGDIDLVVGNGIKAYIKGDIAKELANKLFPELKNKDTNNTYPTGSGLVYNPETGGLLDIAKQEKQKREEEELKKKEEELKKKDEERKNLPKDSVTQATTQTFEELIKNTMYYDKIKDIINKKSKEEGWGKVPKNPKKLAEYLQKHGVEVMSIGTSKEDIETWIDTLENCK